MHADTTMLLAILMKNEDIWLKIPSQQLFDDVILAMQLVGLEYATQGGFQIQVISLEGKRRREQEAAIQQAQYNAQMQQLQIRQQMLHNMSILDNEFLGKIKLDPPDIPKGNTLSDKIRKLIGGSSKGSENEDF